MVHNSFGCSCDGTQSEMHDTSRTNSSHNTATQTSRRRQRGIQLIQQRWRRDDSDGACRNGNANESFPNEAATSGDGNRPSRHAAITVVEQPALAFRRNCSSILTSWSARLYTDLQFLGGGGVVVGVDNYGDLDIVRLPSTRAATAAAAMTSRRATSTTSATVSGVGSMQADRMSIGSNVHRRDAIVNSYNNDYNNNGAVPRFEEGPRQPMSNFHYELYGYNTGMNLAVGLRCGRVHLFTTERRCHCPVQRDSSSSSRRNQLLKNDSSSLLLATNTKSLWSCLPLSPSTSIATIGPQRRYRRNDQYPLSNILSSGITTAPSTPPNNYYDKKSIFDAYNTFVFEEISDWDISSSSILNTNDNNNCSRRHHQNLLRIQGNGCPWAFREGGGMSSTSLIGACVDVDNGDCFSLRVIDERCYSSHCCHQHHHHQEQQEHSSCLNVIVVDDRNAPSKSSRNCIEKIDSVCFTGEFGLVTSHSISSGSANDEPHQLTATSLKWWDHRMLRSHQPVKTLCLSFPRDKVSLVSPEREMCLEGSFCHFWETKKKKKMGLSRSNHPPSPSLRKLSSQQPLDRTNFGMFQLNRLVGSRDSSDRFAIHLKVYSHTNPNHHDHDEVLLVDSCRGEITQQIRHENFGGLSPSMSSYLDTMACFTTTKDDDEEEEQCISIYDISRHGKYDIASSSGSRSNRDIRHDLSSNDYLSGKKRQFQSQYDDDDDDDIIDGKKTYDDGLLRRLSPKVHDVYGIQSSITCVAIDEYGDSIAFGTSDGDIFMLNGSDLGGLAS